MDQSVTENLPRFLEVLGMAEEPMGVHFTDKEPAEGFTPKRLPLPTREKEAQNAIDWGEIFQNFSCAIGHVWRARQKKTIAYFDQERFGCPGAAFFCGFLKPQSWTLIHYVSTGLPGRLEGEKYIDSPQTLDRIFAEIDPLPATKKFLVFKPLGQFQDGEIPELIAFFARPEHLSGLHQLAAFVTADPEVVASPWGAACTGLVTWPRRYLAQGQTKAVLGGWDCSARKYFKTDELSFTVPWGMFLDMLRRWPESFLTTHTWEIVRKKIERSKRTWGETKAEGGD